MAVSRTTALMQRADRSGRTVMHRDFPGRANLEAQALYATQLRSHVYRPGPAWRGPQLQAGEDPSVALLAPRRSKGRTMRFARASVLIVAVILLSPVLPNLIA